MRSAPPAPTTRRSKGAPPFSAAGLGTTTFARAEGGTLLGARAGSVLTSLAVRTLGDLADDGLRSGLDGAAQARASASLPLSRAFASPDHEDPWIHRTEPRVELAALASHAGDVLVVPAGRGMTVPGGGAWIAAVGWSNAFGRWAARTAAVLDVSAGAVGDDRSALAALRARASASAPLASLQADFARVAGPVDASSGTPSASGGALVARGRLGPANGLHLTANVAERDGVDPVVARALVDAPLEPASGFLALPGWTGGARLAVPVGPRITARGGADADFSAPGGAQLVAAVGALELHDPCGCVVVRATAAHRIGRDGVDVWLTVDLPR